MERQDELAGVMVGHVLAGKYRIERVLGQGAMGVVVAAHHLQLDERVAIKFLLAESLANADTVMRFAREARAAVKIKSEHVARVTDVGTLENGSPYMVMEYLEGGDLSGWLATQGPLPVELAVDFVLQACEAIAEAHALGIVHRDLKPANLFVAHLPGGVQSVKVLDFGISKMTGLSGSGSGGQDSATRTQALMGSPLYMSPEQMQSSKDVDARTDVWALGIILHELITGASPFVSDTMPELVLKIMQTEPAPLRVSRPDAPEGVETAIFRCLTKARTQRFQTVGALASALAPFGSRKARLSLERISRVMAAAGMSNGDGVATLPSAPPSAVGAGTAKAFGTSVQGEPRKSPAVALGLVALIAAGVAGAFVAREHLVERTAPLVSVNPPTPELPKSVSGSVSPAPPVSVLPVPTPVELRTAPSATPVPEASAAASTTPPTSAPPARAAAPPARVPLRTAGVRTARAPEKSAAKAPTPPADTPKKAAAGPSLIDDRY